MAQLVVDHCDAPVGHGCRSAGQQQHRVCGRLVGRGARTSLSLLLIRRCRRLSDEPVVGTTRVARLIDPDVAATISVAVNATGPGSIAARAFVAAARSLSFGELSYRSTTGNRRAPQVPTGPS